LLYGTGLRQAECLQLRVKDLDFAQKQVVVRDGKGMESRATMLPTSLVEELQFNLQIVKRLHQQDLEKGYGSVDLPFALERKYKNADREWIWQFVFPSRWERGTQSLGFMIDEKSQALTALLMVLRCATRLGLEP